MTIHISIELCYANGIAKNVQRNGGIQYAD